MKHREVKYTQHQGLYGRGSFHKATAINDQAAALQQTSSEIKPIANGQSVQPPPWDFKWCKSLSYILVLILGSERRAGCWYLCSRVQRKEQRLKDKRGIIPDLDTPCQEDKNFWIKLLYIEIKRDADDSNNLYDALIWSLRVRSLGFLYFSFTHSDSLQFFSIWLVCLPSPHQGAVNTTSLTSRKKSKWQGVILVSWNPACSSRYRSATAEELGKKRECNWAERNPGVRITESFVECARCFLC